MNLEEKKARLKEIRAQITALSTEERAIEQEIAEAGAQFKVGQHIEWRHGNGKRHGVIKGIHPYYSGCEYIVSNIRADGSEGASVRVTPWNKPAAYTATE